MKKTTTTTNKQKKPVPNSEMVTFYFRGQNKERCHKQCCFCTNPSRRFSGLNNISSVSFHICQALSSSIQDRLDDLVVKASATRAEDPRFAPGFFRGRVIPVTSKLALQWLPCQSPGVIGSVLGLVGPVSVYCDWVRGKVWSATSNSVWQHVQLSVQIRP